MPDSQNLKSLKAAYEEWGTSKKTGNIGRLTGLMAANCRVGSMEQNIVGTTFAAQNQAIAYLNGIFQEWEMIYFKPETYVEQGDTIAMFGMCSWRHKGTGNPVECRIANLWEFRDGKAISLLDVFDSAKAVAAATPP